VFVVEGSELVRTALAADARIESLYVDADSDLSEVAELAERHGARVFELASGVVARVGDTVTPQPVLGVFAMLDQPVDQVLGPPLVVVCAEVRDPGNAGTIVRSADAAGVGAVLFAGSSVDPYNPKTVRSSAGSLFHVPLGVEVNLTRLLDQLKDRGYRRLGTVAHGGEDYTQIDWNTPTAIVLGNETHGLDEALELDATVQIPMAGRAESLNVGMACAVLCFEALRQRRSTMPGMGEQ
jgi:TrmH family RNA methyltransferase